MATQESANIAQVLEYANQPTLVKYNNPVVVGTVRKNVLLPDSGKKMKPKIPEVCQENYELKKESQEFFDKLISSRQWIIDGEIWRQSVSITPGARSDVIRLAEQLNTRLKQGKAQLLGICAIRREFYSQCFDEIIRQVTINCTERGLLLVKVRNEALQTLEAYRSIFESASAYTMRRALWAMSKRGEIERTIRDTKLETEIAVSNLADLQRKHDDLRDKFQENALVESLKHSEESKALRQNNERLKRLLGRTIIIKGPGSEEEGIETRMAKLEAAEAVFASSQASAAAIAVPAQNAPAPDLQAQDTPSPDASAIETPAPDIPSPDSSAIETPAPDTPAPDEPSN